MFNDISTRYNSGEISFDLNGINNAELYGLINILYKKIYGEDIDYYDILKGEHNKIEVLKDKYILGDDVKTIFDNVRELLKEDGLLFSIIAASDNDYNRGIKNIPFGANNYLNKAFKEKKVDLELLNADNNSVNNLIALLNFTRQQLDDIYETARIAEGNIVNIHRNLGLNLASIRLETINSFISKMKDSSDLSQEIKDLFNNSFADFSIDEEDYIFDKNDSEENLVSYSANNRSKLLDFEKRWYAFYSSLNEAGKLELIKVLKDWYQNREYDNATVNNNVDRDLLFNDASM
jgi:hypothetical protein